MNIIDHYLKKLQADESINVRIKDLGTNRNHPSLIHMLYEHKNFHLKNYREDDTQKKLTDFSDTFSSSDAIMGCFAVAHMGSSDVMYGSGSNVAEFHVPLKVEVIYSGHWRDPVLDAI